ncbi:unnamed protein product [Closterium sp. NIES-54]
MPVSVALADPTSGPVTARYTTTLPCPAVPSGSLTGFHVPSFSRNLVGVRPLMSQHMGVWIEPSGETAVCVDEDTYAPLATFTAEPGSGLYTLHTGPRRQQQQQRQQQLQQQQLLPPTPWSCCPALPDASPYWLSRALLLPVASPCPARRIALQLHVASPCPARRVALLLPVVTPCWLSRPPAAAFRVALPCPRAALLAVAPPCPARAKPLCHPAARTALLRAALLLAPPSCCPPCCVQPC